MVTFLQIPFSFFMTRVCIYVRTLFLSFLLFDWLVSLGRYAMILRAVRLVTGSSPLTALKACFPPGKFYLMRHVEAIGCKQACSETFQFWLMQPR